MSRRLLITLAIGDVFQKMGKITHPLMKRYAYKYGADFHCIEESKFTDKIAIPTYEKFQIYDFLDGQYEWVLFVDTDILISPYSPNIFDLCLPHQFGVSEEEGYSMVGTHKEITQKKLGVIDWRNKYFNSGVMLVSPHHKELFNPNNVIFQKWVSDFENNDHVMSDQPILNYMVNYYKFQIKDFGYKFNHTRVIADTKSRFKSYFIHYSGPSGHRYGERLEQIKLDSIVLNSPFNLLISRKFVYYRWVADRFNKYFIKYLLNKWFFPKSSG